MNNRDLLLHSIEPFIKTLEVITPPDLGTLNSLKIELMEQKLEDAVNKVVRTLEKVELRVDLLMQRLEERDEDRHAEEEPKVVKRECKVKVCFLCGREGHFVRTCPTRLRTEKQVTMEHKKKEVIICYED